MLVDAVRRSDENRYRVTIDAEHTTADCGASIQQTTNIGQKTYLLVLGTGGEDAYADAAEGEEAEYLGKRATITVLVSLYADNNDSSLAAVYTITITRLYVPSDEVETAG